MIEQDFSLTTPEEVISADELRDQHLQRRVLRLLLQHHEMLFRQQFRLFFAESALPPLPLLQQYDRFMKLRVLGSELLGDIMPRIRRELSLRTDHSRLREEAPTRGDIDWPRTLEHNLSQQPGLPPQQFETRLRQRTLETPENVLVVSLILVFHREVQAVLREQFRDEELSPAERQTLVSLDEQAERELAAAYARALLEQAEKVDLGDLAERVAAHLRPGSGPYRDLLNWWQRFQGFRVGRAAGTRSSSLASKRTGEKTSAWLYELWIALELFHLLSQEGAVQAQDVQIVTDALQCTFTWQGQRFRLIYNRQLNTSTTYEPDWLHGPTTRPDYTIERVKPLAIRHNSQLIWREPPFVLDAKYYLEGSDPAHTHGPIKKLLGDMTLLGARHGVLFFPRLPEPEEGQTVTRTLRRSGKQYTSAQECQIQLYHLEPQMELATLQTRLRALLDSAIEYLPERPAPACRGIVLDSDTINVSNWKEITHHVLCPKPHIGAGVFDIVNPETDCLKNSLLCHVMDQAIVPPFVLRVLTQEELERQCQLLRTRGNELLKAAEQAGDDARAEQLRQHIFHGIGRAVEQYVRLFGNTTQIESKFREWVFGPYWQGDRRSLAENTRRSLISGEHIWENYNSANVLQDWAAPAVQYCRTLEAELKRRLYYPIASTYKSIYGFRGFTLGTVTSAYDYRTSRTEGEIWKTMLSRVAADKRGEFERIVQRMSKAKIHDERNKLAHGDPVSKELATRLREMVIGTIDNPGILRTLAELVNPV
ncbi:MAG TPA: hypothetical protein VF458_13745 [Ktedonobacteraceae bacterium]